MGYNQCPLQRKEGERWHRSEVNPTIAYAPPLLKPAVRESVESLQEICIRSAVGLDCWNIHLPERHRQPLSELNRDYDLCEECLQPVRKLKFNTRPVVRALNSHLHGNPFTNNYEHFVSLQATQFVLS